MNKRPDQKQHDRIAETVDPVLFFERRGLTLSPEEATILRSGARGLPRSHRLAALAAMHKALRPTDAAGIAAWQETLRVAATDPDSIAQGAAEFDRRLKDLAARSNPGEDANSPAESIARLLHGEGGGG